MSFFPKRNNNIKSSDKVPEKTLVGWSDPELYQTIIADSAIVHDCSKTAIIEDALRTTYFGKSQLANNYIKINLYSQETGNLQCAFHAVFSQAHAHVSFEPKKYATTKPLVEYMQQLFFQPSPPMKLNDGEYSYIDTYMRLMLDSCNSAIEENDTKLKTYEEIIKPRLSELDDQELTRFYAENIKTPKELREIKEIADMIEFLRHDFEKNHTENCNGTIWEMLNLILSYWNYVNIWRSTYGFLQAVAAKATWETTPMRRYKMRELIIAVCDEWSEV